MGLSAGFTVLYSLALLLINSQIKSLNKSPAFRYYHSPYQLPQRRKENGSQLLKWRSVTLGMGYPE